MVLTQVQELGLKIAVTRYKTREPWTCISGYAGSGKTTLVKFIISALNIEEDDVCYIAYTGKAAKVLKERGCPNAMTAHKLLYQSYLRADGTFYHKIKRPLDHNYKIIVVDEISMLPKQMWDLLLTHNIHIICLGDPFQLPPIGEDNGVLASPHIFLDEIMRQEADSEIIRTTLNIRNGKPLIPYKGQEVQIIKPNEIDGGMYQWANQIIVGKNLTRTIINNQMRKLIFNVDSQEPIEGDKIICLRNNWDIGNEAGDVLVNGLTGFISNIQINKYHPIVHPLMTANFLPDDYTQEEIENLKVNPYFENIKMDYKLFTEGEETVNSKNFKTFPKMWRPEIFDYAYAITCHKAQGSEYDKVLVFEEYLKGGDHARWLYTAATRARQKLIIVQSK